jgi:hypothetical protein
MIVDGNGPCGWDAGEMSLTDYARQRLADLRIGATGAMWGVFLDDVEGLPSGLVMPID